MVRSSRLRRLKRMRQIVNVAASQGFGYVIEQLGLGDLLSWRHRLNLEDQKRHKLTRGRRIMAALEELGPVFIKLGQIMSTRPDLIPEDIVAELRHLQDRVAPFPFEEVRKVVEEDLGAPLEEIYEFFDPHTLGSASIGQVHEARLVSGESVVVKVQRPGLKEMAETDLAILFDLARLAQRHTAWGRLYNFTGAVREFADTLRVEMDYQAEGRHADRIRTNTDKNAPVYIPAVFWEQTTTRVLTMEMVSAPKLNQPDELTRAGTDRPAVARILTRLILKQMLVDGFFHADLHPGNLAVLPGQVLVLMDFGMVGHLSPEIRAQCIEVIRGLMEHDTGRIVRAYTAMGLVPDDEDRNSLREDLERLRNHYYDMPFKELSLGQIMNEFLGLAFKYHLHIPAELTVLAKTLVTLEAVACELDPSLNIAEVATNFGKEVLFRGLGPEELRKRLVRTLRESASMAAQAPANLSRLLDKLANENLSIELDHRHLPQVRGQLERIANRLSFSIVLLSFCIVMSALVISSALLQRGPSLFFLRLPILEIGFGAAMVMFIWLLISILRSGRF